MTDFQIDPGQMQRFLSGETSPEEEQRVVVQLKALDFSDENPVDKIGGWKRLQNKLHGQSKPRRAPSYRSAFVVSLSVLIIALAGIKYLPRLGIGLGSPSNSSKTYVTQPGQRASITLADGSTMLLAPATTARVNGRAVDLSGEALFTVTSRTGAPFIVTADGVTARVLGTSFSVRKYAEDEGVRLVVAEGKIGVANKVLTVGDAATIGNSGEISVKREVNIAAELAWTTGRLGFDNVRFRETIPSLERWYGVHINADNEIVLNTRITTLFEQESTEQAMRLIAEMLGAQLIHHGTTVTFTSRGK